MKELKAAGIDKARARKIGLYVDERRNTEHDENIESIRQILKDRKPPESERAERPPVSESEK